LTALRCVRILAVARRLRSPCHWSADPSPDPSFTCTASHLASARFSTLLHPTRYYLHPLTGPPNRPKPTRPLLFIVVDTAPNSLPSLNPCRANTSHSPPTLWKHHWRPPFFRPSAISWTLPPHRPDLGLIHVTVAGRRAFNHARIRGGKRTGKRSIAEGLRTCHRPIQRRNGSQAP
jgi:hypothetical protein